MQKTRDFKVDFWKFFWGIPTDPITERVYGPRRPFPNLHPSLGTVVPPSALRPLPGNKADLWMHCPIFTPLRYTERGICYANSVCLSVTRVYCIKTAERIIEIVSLSHRPIILVFWHQGSLRKSEGVTPNGGAKYKGGSDFRPIYGYISETVRDRGWGIFTIQEEYKVVCALSNGATFADLEWPRTPVSRSQYILKANILPTVHPIHSMFVSMLGFSRSADRMALFAFR